MPAVADIQNTIVKEFADDPRVVTAVMGLAGQGAPSPEDFWRNIYLRGQVIDDPDGSVNGLYGQPWTLLPASRSFLIAPDQTVALPSFGHHPDRITDAIHDLLAATFNPGDFDGDGDVDANDYDQFPECFTGPETDGFLPECSPGDFDGSDTIDCTDWGQFQQVWTGVGDPPLLARCESTQLTFETRDLVTWHPDPPFESWNVYRGALGELKSGGSYTQAPGSNSLARRTCGVIGDSTVDDFTPPAGKVAFYIVSGVFSGLEATLGQCSGVERSNDNPCPAGPSPTITGVKGLP